VISVVNPFENLIAARLLRLFSTRTHWHRTLWNAGTVLALREVLEASQAQNAGHLSERSVRGAVVTALRLLKDDPGIGNAAERIVLTESLTFDGEAKNEIHYKGLEYEQIHQLVDRAAPLHTQRWAEALTAELPPSPERASRAIASHLLDRGFNSNFLHRWWSYRLHIRQAFKILADFAGAIQDCTRVFSRRSTGGDEIDRPHFAQSCLESALDGALRRSASRRSRRCSQRLY
jgi:hypothetical protein